MIKRLGVLVSAALVLGSLRAECQENKIAASTGTSFNVTAECQMVLLPQKAALKLLPDLVDDDKLEAGFARLQTMIDSGEASA